MKFKKNRPQLSFTVSELTKDAIEQVAKEIGINRGRALDVIIREWKTGKEIEPVNSKLKISDLNDFGNSLKNIEKRMRTIEKLTAWQVRKMTD